MVREICVFCGKVKGITRHHLTIKPLRKNRKTPDWIPLCTTCHRMVEAEKQYLSKANKLRKAYKKGFEAGQQDIIDCLKLFDWENISQKNQNEGGKE